MGWADFSMWFFFDGRQPRCPGLVARRQPPGDRLRGSLSQAAIPAGAQVIDLNGAAILPGVHYCACADGDSLRRDHPR